MLGARLHFRSHTEGSGVLEAVSTFKIVVAFVEHEERLAGNPGHTLLEARIQGIQALIESLEVALVFACVGGVFFAQVSGHFCRNHSGIVRGQPQMRIQGAGAMIVVMFGGIFFVRMAIFGEMTQFQARQGLDRHRWQGPALDYPWQKPFHVRADPVQQVRRLHTPYVGWAQCIVMRRGIGRQKHLRMPHAVLHGSSNQLQGFDAGQHVDLGPGRVDHKQTGA